MSHFSEVERPGTSFNQKRQVVNHQGDRFRHMKLGQLDTDLNKAQVFRTSFNLRTVKGTSLFTTPNQQKDEVRFNSSTLLKSNRNFFSKPRDFSFKQLPQALQHDREKLYEEIILVKQELNRVKQECHKLKTKNLNLEEEIQRQHKNYQKSGLNSAMMNQMDVFYKEEKSLIQDRTGLSGDLRIQIRDLHKEIEKKDQAIMKMKKNYEFSKFCEIEVELDTYKREHTRLQFMLGYAMNLNEQENTHKNANVSITQALENIIKIIKQDNVELAYLNKTKEDQIKLLNQKNTLSETNLMKTTQSKLGYQRLIKGFQKELDEIKQRDPFLMMKKSQSNNLEKQLQIQLDERIAECNTLNSKIQRKDKTIFDCEKKIKDFQTSMTFKIIQHEKEKNDMNECFSQQLISGQNSARTTTKKLTYRAQNSSKVDENSQRDSVNLEKQESEIETEQYNKRVERQEVAELGQHLKFTFLNLRIALNDLDQYTQSSSENGNLTLEELEKCFQNEPFSLSQIDSLRLARYIVEDNDRKSILFNYKSEVNSARVKSILRNLMDNYEVLSVPGEISLNNQLSTIFKKYKNALEDAIMKIKQNQHQALGDGICSINDLLEAFHSLDVQFTQKMCTQILQKNYQITQQIHSLNYHQLFKFHSQKVSVQGANLYTNNQSNDNSYIDNRDVSVHSVNSSFINTKSHYSKERLEKVDHFSSIEPIVRQQNKTNIESRFLGSPKANNQKQMQEFLETNQKYPQIDQKIQPPSDFTDRKQEDYGNDFDQELNQQQEQEQAQQLLKELQQCIPQIESEQLQQIQKDQEYQQDQDYEFEQDQYQGQDQEFDYDQDQDQDNNGEQYQTQSKLQYGTEQKQGSQQFAQGSKQEVEYESQQDDQINQQHSQKQEHGQNFEHLGELQKEQDQQQDLAYGKGYHTHEEQEQKTNDYDQELKQLDEHSKQKNQQFSLNKNYDCKQNIHDQNEQNIDDL